MKDCLKIFSENYSCMTMKPPEQVTNSLISARPISSRQNANISMMIFLLMTLLHMES